MTEIEKAYTEREDMLGIQRNEHGEPDLSDEDDRLIDAIQTEDALP